MEILTTGELKKGVVFTTPLVEMRRVELLSKKTMHQASPSADVFKVSFKFLKHQTPSEVAFVNLYG